MDGDTMAALHVAPIVYVVDDDPLVLAFVETVLTPGGYQVTGFREADAAVLASQAVAPTLFMLDIRMPDMDGVELLGCLRRIESCRTTPVIMLTGGGRLDRIVLAMSAGADDYLMKPFTAEQALAKIRKLLGDDGFQAPGNI
jgi:DNA-binding response OmpR family regulator